ncbi:DUF2075 domain-containing protein [Microcoleus sp. MON2_D6]|uniref:hypothetical protein n=1 Tax=unclassified Microcoleus TaxID=2642155 RepID=UPI002FD57D10
MYVYVTQQCKDNAKKYGIESEIKKLSDESDALIRFNPIHPYWKRNIGNLRLLAKIEKVDNDPILCLLNIFPRGGREYDEEFLLNRKGFGEKYLEPLLENPAELQDWLNGQKESGNQQQNQRQPLPHELLNWLELPSWSRDSNDLVIYESEQWMRRFGQETFKDRRESYHGIICEISKPDEMGEITDWPHVKLYSNSQGRSVLFSKIETLATEDIPARPVLLLLAPFADKVSPENIAEVVRATNLCDSDGNANISLGKLELDDLARIAPRSYRYYLLWDFEIWLSIEKQEESNLSLSGEEEKILQSVSTPGQPSLPIFINGRAGSGKSTMLFHLFAEYCERHYKYSEQQKVGYYEKPHPLFITYNEGLVKVAKESVQKMLESHEQMLKSRKESDTVPDIEPFFQPFQKFLLDLLPPTDRESFQPEKYISYNHFRLLYKDSKLPEANNKSYSAGRCWHIIRTFIKGYILDEYMTLEIYREVPRKERTISEETFQKIYETIWERWYKGLTEKSGYWDDQDLIQKVLKLKCYRPDYTAIFCDESQDFTRLELRLIMQLSVFSQYDFGYHRPASLPCAFAGDPFQTLNPTGFRWDSVSASFYNEVIMTLDPAGELNLGMNFKDLKVNYRSSASIVRVTNLIQLWRRLRFDLTELKPQTPWQKDSASKPQKFIQEPELLTAELKRYIEKRPIFIVPCEAGGEIEYIQNDPVLVKLFPQVTEGKTPENVYSAIKAKGLEFPLVILYKFGDELVKEYPESERLLWNFDNGGDDSVELEYFFNKLYVASSRAMSDLVIIDSEAGDKLLWQRASEGGLKQFLERLEKREREVWADLLGTISEAESLEVLDQDNREIQAQRLKKQGETEENPELLRNAKELYDLLGKTLEADECKALALKLEKQFSEAGQVFLKRKKVDEAWECFWNGACWQELKEWYANNPEKKPVERHIADFMAQTPKPVDEFTKFLKDSLESNRLKKNRCSKPWQEAVKEYASQIEELIGGKNFDNSEQGRQFGNTLEDLDEAGYFGTLEVAGNCFYRFKDYTSAVRCWDRCQATQKDEYYLAKAEVLPVPDRLEYLEKAGKAQHIVKEWETQGKPVKPQWLKYVEPALEKQKRYQDLVDHLISRKSWLKATEAIDRCPNAGETESLRFNLVRAIAYSDLTPEEALEDRKRYVNFIAQVRNASSWQQALSVQEVGTALEKIGELVQVLKFYEEFVGDSNSKLRQFARERWIATKKKQEVYEQGTDGDKLDITQQKLAENARKWNIDPKSISSDPALEPDYRRVDATLSPSELSNQLVEEDSHWKTVAKGIEQRQIGRLQVVRMKALKQLTFSDDTSNTLQLNLESGHCTANGKVEVEPSGSSNRLLFKVSESGYTCEVFYGGNHPKVELNTKDFGKMTLTL